MMRQQEAAKDDREIAASTEVKDEGKEGEGKKARRRHRIRRAVAALLMGLLFSFAPQYIQTNNTWVVSASQLLFVACLAPSFYYLYDYIHEVSRDFKSLLNIVMAFTAFCAIVFYIASGPGENISSNPSYPIELRAVSFVCLIMTVSLLIARFPNFVAFCTQYKSQIKAFPTVKNIFAAVGAAVVFLTALFQFMQVLLQIFHR